MKLMIRTKHLFLLILIIQFFIICSSRYAKTDKMKTRKIKSINLNKNWKIYLNIWRVYLLFNQSYEVNSFLTKYF